MRPLFIVQFKRKNPSDEFQFAIADTSIFVNEDVKDQEENDMLSSVYDQSTGWHYAQWPRLNEKTGRPIKNQFTTCALKIVKFGDSGEELKCIIEKLECGDLACLDEDTSLKRKRSRKVNSKFIDFEAYEVGNATKGKQTSGGPSRKRVLVDTDEEDAGSGSGDDIIDDHDEDGEEGTDESGEKDQVPEKKKKAYKILKAGVNSKKSGLTASAEKQLERLRHKLQAQAEGSIKHFASDEATTSSGKPDKTRGRSKHDHAHQFEQQVSEKPSSSSDDESSSSSEEPVKSGGKDQNYWKLYYKNKALKKENSFLQKMVKNNPAQQGNKSYKQEDKNQESKKKDQPTNDNSTSMRKLGKSDYMVDSEKFDRMAKQKYSQYAGDLLVLVVGRSVVANSSLTGAPSKATKKDNNKSALPSKLVDAVVGEVLKEFPGVLEPAIRAAIRMRCNNEFTRQQHRDQLPKDLPKTLSPDAETLDHLPKDPAGEGDPTANIEGE